MDEVSHNRRLVKRLHRHLGCLHVLKNHFGDPQVLLVLRIVQDLHLLDVAKFFAHVIKKALPDVVVEAGERHLLGRHGADVTLVDLEESGREEFTSEEREERRKKTLHHAVHYSDSCHHSGTAG